MKQIVLGMTMYNSDYDEKYPGIFMSYADTNWGTRYMGFYDTLEPYTENQQIFICPSHSWTRDNYRSGLPNAEGFFGREFEATYGVVNNYNIPFIEESPLEYSLSEDWGRPGKKLAEVEQPANTVLYVELDYYGYVVYPQYRGFDDSGNPVPMDDDTVNGLMYYGHNGMMNVGYIDGHAKAHGQFTDPDVFDMDKD